MKDGVAAILRFSLGAKEHRAVVRINKTIYIEQMYKDRLGVESWQDVDDGDFTFTSWSKLVSALLVGGPFNRDLGRID